MNTSDLRLGDYDAYRQRAKELRDQAMQRFIDRSAAWLKHLLRRHAEPPRKTGSCSAQCPA
jgi:anaerobic glycerol-3-phosphate dehydrogenase